MGLIPVCPLMSFFWSKGCNNAISCPNSLVSSNLRQFPGNIIIIIFCATRLAGSQFPHQGLNPGPLLGSTES